MYISDLENELSHLLHNDYSEPTNSELKKLRELNKLLEHVDTIREITTKPIETVNQLFVYVHDKETKKFKRLNGENKIAAPRGRYFTNPLIHLVS